MEDNVGTDTYRLPDLPTGTLVNYFREDTSNESTLGPGAGEQNYDSEFLGLMVEVEGAGYRISIAISTGQRPDNGFSGSLGLFSPGDIVFTTTSGKVFGIEVGGGAVEGAGTAVLENGLESYAV